MDDYRVKQLPAPDMSAEAFLAVLRAARSPVRDEEARRVYAYAVARTLSPAFLLAMFRHESSFGTQGWARTTHSWGNTRPPSYGVKTIEMVSQDTPDRGRYLSLYDDWLDGGLSTVARFFEHPPYRSKYTVREIIPVWAPASENDTEAYIAALLADIALLTAPPPPGATKGTTMPRIALASGHHNTDGGDQFEAVQTGFLTAAVAHHCKALGMDVRIVTPGQGAGMFPGGIWDVARAVVALADGGWVPDIFLETHTEGGGGTGVFAIYPDAAGDLDADVRDTLGPDAARRIAAATGLRVGGLRNGTMSERETGVGRQGSRLGIFNKTEPIKGSTTRLIIEYGAHDKEPDLSIAKAPGFYDRCGRATAEAFAAFLGVPVPPVAVLTAPRPAGWLNVGDEDRFKWEGEGIIVERWSRWYNPEKGKFFHRKWAADHGYEDWVEEGVR